MIITAIIGLIILVAVILMITGKFGAFGEGTDDAISCKNVCESIGKTGDEDSTCTGGQKVVGDYKEGSNCCCKAKGDATTATTPPTTTRPTADYVGYLMDGEE